MKCPYRQVYNPEGAKFDINCGQPSQTETACTSCGETVAVRSAIPAKHSGQSARMPTPPTGKEITMRASIFARTRNDKIIEAWWDTGYRGVMQRPGIPVPSQYISDGVYL